MAYINRDEDGRVILTNQQKAIEAAIDKQPGTYRDIAKMIDATADTVSAQIPAVIEKASQEGRPIGSVGKVGRRTVFGRVLDHTDAEVAGDHEMMLFGMAIAVLNRVVRQLTAMLKKMDRRRRSYRHMEALVDDLSYLGRKTVRIRDEYIAERAALAEL